MFSSGDHYSSLGLTLLLYVAKILREVPYYNTFTLDHYLLTCLCFSLCRKLFETEADYLVYFYVPDCHAHGF